MSFDGQERVSITQFGRVVSDDACWLKLDTIGTMLDLHTLAGRSETEEFLAISVAKNGRVVAAVPIKSDTLFDILSPQPLIRDTTKSKGIAYWRYSYDGTLVSAHENYGNHLSNYWLNVTAYADGKIFSGQGGHFWMVDSQGKLSWKEVLNGAFPLDTRAFEDVGIFTAGRLEVPLTWKGETTQPG